MIMTLDVTTVHELTGEDVLDSRDLIELGERVQAWLDDPDRDADEYDETDAREIVAAVAEFEAAGVEPYGEAFIRDSYFETYARDLAGDIGAVSGDESWPLSYIDWPAATDALRMDYTAVEVDGVTFWGRS